MYARNLPKEIAIPGRKNLQLFLVLIGILPAFLGMGAYAAGSAFGVILCGGITLGIWTLAGKIKTVKKLRGGVYV